MYLEKSKIYFSVIIIIILLQSNIVNSKNADDIKLDIKNYLKEIKNFSSSFIENNNNSISEGNIYIGNERVRVDYNSPVKILLTIGAKKAMYHNIDLQETEFFDPRRTPAWFFFDIFKNKNFIERSEFFFNENQVRITKSSVFDDKEYLINIFFEYKPINLRKISLKSDEGEIFLSFFDHNYYSTFDRKFFRLIPPKP